MVGAHPSMPHMLGGCEHLDPARGCTEKCVGSGNDHKVTRVVDDGITIGQGGEVIDLPLNKLEGFIRRTRPSFLANYFVEPFIAAIRQKRQKQTRELLEE